MAARVANQDELDRLVGEWTRDQEAFALQERLQKAGVPAGVCQTAEDRVERDPQLRHLKWLIPLPHAEIGTWPIKDVPFHFTNAKSIRADRWAARRPAMGKTTIMCMASFSGCLRRSEPS